MPCLARRWRRRRSHSRSRIRPATPAGNSGPCARMRRVSNGTCDRYDMNRIAVFGGIYNNHLALGAALADARRRGVDAIYCLGDLGAFGPHPDRVFPLLRDAGVTCLRGNYDDSIGQELGDCQCGYTDPRDNHFARLSYDYTLANTSPENRRWLRSLPGEIRLE